MSAASSVRHPPLCWEQDGWLTEAERIASPNHDARPAGVAPELIVIHAISLPPRSYGGDGVARLFTNTLDVSAHPYYEGIAHLRVSAHFFVRRCGHVVQFVSADARAWHAGVSYWRGRERCNDFSIGIELEGCDEQAFRVEQYESLARLVRALRLRYPICDMLGHSDVAPGRKTDPGPCFEWARLQALLSSLV